MRLLKEISTFKIGGPALSIAEAKTVAEMSSLLKEVYPRRMVVIGKGSNCLFSDQGFNGLVILNKIDFISSIKPIITVGAGFSFALLGSRTARAGFTGLEFAAGIPASVGGGIFMNAGANGQEAADTLISVDFLNEKGELFTFLKKDLDFSYRYSSFQGMKGAIVSATFGLTKDPLAREKQLKIVEYRQKTQPYGEPSIGCVFRNPIGDCCHSAAALIDQAGLKEVAIGGAKVSEKHANFIINPKGLATASDVEALIKIIKEKVFAHAGILLEEEIRKIAFES